MTISSELTKLNTNLTNSYTACQNKGATMPSAQNFDNLATCIVSIQATQTAQMNGREVKNGVYQAPTESFILRFSDDVTDIGYYAFYYMLQSCTSLTSANLSNLTTVSGTYAFYQAFGSCKNLTSVNLSNLTTISGNSAFSSAFNNCTSLTSVNLSNLTTISGNSAFSSAFNKCTSLTSINLPKLTTISGTSAFYKAFNSCGNLSSLYFNALKTTSFGSYVNQFNNMMQGTGSTVTHTIHFPSNLESTIQTLTGYPLFGGTSGYVVLAYDLPATS